jgi:transcriptional regulator with XRE-family HTH domain
MSENQNRLWAAYVAAVAGDMTATAIAEQIEQRVGLGVSQPTVSRWLRGSFSGELRPANVAAFATAFERPVLEAFVAGNLLKLEEARPGLDDESVAFVASLGSRRSRVTTPASRASRTRRPRPPRA